MEKIQQQLDRENYYFVKKLYWDLIIFFMKREQNDHTKKCIKDLQQGWEEYETYYLNIGANVPKL